MARSIKDSFDLLDTSRTDIRNALAEKSITAPESMKISEVDDYIKQVKGKADFKINVPNPGYPSDTVFTARHTDGTSVSGKLPLTVSEEGTYTITDSFSNFSDSIKVSETFDADHVLPSITVTTDVDNGEIQTCTQGSTVISATVSSGKVVFYVPKTGTWTIGYSGSTNTTDVSVSSRTNYTAEYTKIVGKVYHFVINNASSVSTFYIQNPGYDSQYNYGIQKIFQNTSNASTFKFDLVLTEEEYKKDFIQWDKLWLTEKVTYSHSSDGTTDYGNGFDLSGKIPKWEEGSTHTYDWNNKQSLWYY